jgi:hypothetical protein
MNRWARRETLMTLDLTYADPPDIGESLAGANEHSRE